MQPRKAPNRYSGGFTLIETMYSIFLTAIAGLILAASMPAAQKGWVKANDYAQAVEFAQQHIERARAQGYGGLTANALKDAGVIDTTAPIAPNTYPCSHTESASGNSIAQRLPNGSGRLTLSQEDRDLRRITVEVSFSEGGVPRKYELSTLIANL